MKYTVVMYTLILAGLVQPAVAAKHREPAEAQRSAKAVVAQPSGAPATGKSAARTVSYDPRSIVPIRSKIRFTTVIVLPKDEVIVDFVVGDKDIWIVEGEQNVAYCKPAQERSSSNLNLVTESGNVYSFLLTEVSGQSGVDPDLKVYVELKDVAADRTVSAPKRFVPVRDLEDSQRQLEEAKAEAERAKATGEAAAQLAVQGFVAGMRFPYTFAAGKRPFNIRSMFHDGRFSYIFARPEETPTLYEVRDGQPALVEFTYSNGLYVTSRVLGNGYFVIGKKRLAFKRQE